MTAVAGARLDAHLHLWDLRRGGYSWLTPDHGALYDSFTPEQARTEMDGCGVTGAILVQAEDSERDTEFLLAVAKRHEWVSGVVGWVQLDAPAVVQRQLDRWQRDRVFCGVRQLVHDDPRDDLLQRPEVRRSLAAVAQRGLVLDVPDAWPRHLLATAELAAALPDLPVVLDHLGKPPLDPDSWSRWRAQVAEVAARPNTTAKVSGLQMPGRRLGVDTLRRTWDAALELFGPTRLMWGSDWPMTLLADGYARTWAVLATLIGELSQDEQRLVLSGTAARVYRLRGASDPLA